MTSVRERRTSSLAHEVVTEVAMHEGVEPLDLKTPLYDAIDPEALDALFSRPAGRSADGVRSLAFTYYGYDIHVDADGSISISRGTDTTAYQSRDVQTH